ncbi:MAG: superoxide dismutase family protein, partial [Calditrichia bacterium]
GTITFTKVTGGIQIVANVTGLEPGEHGLHIFENGSCGASDSITLGAHFNPEKMPHGAPNDSLRHEGDLGNLEAVENTITHVEWTDARLSFTGKYSIIGRSVVIDEGPDDFKTQPYGNSGDHVACGVIGIKKEEVPADTTGTLP